MSVRNVEVLIPFESHDPARLRAHTYVREWWLKQREVLPLTAVTTCTAAPWTKGAAVLSAAIKSQAEVLIMADADCVPESGYIGAAIRAITSNSWVVPHTEVIRLDELGTLAVFERGTRPDLASVSYTHRGMAAGGCLVIRRSTMLSVPIDPRFSGWGNEDESWAMALATLAGRQCRLQGKLYHLWHPRAPRLDPYRGSEANAALRDRYKAAKNNPLKMRALLDEFRTEYGL